MTSLPQSGTPRPEQMTPAEIERGLIAKGVPVEQARHAAYGGVRRTSRATTTAMDIIAYVDSSPGPNVSLPFRIVIPWSLLCSDNEKDVGSLTMRNGKPIPRKVMSARYKTAKNAVADKAAIIAGRSSPVTIPLAMHVEVWLPPSRRNDALNFAKCVNDALEGIVYANDNQLHDSRWIRKGVDIDSPRAEITITALSASPTP